MHLFIDTNILLEFYHFSGDDLAELAKLHRHIVDQELTLYVPQHLWDEYTRNRGPAVARSIKLVRDHKLNPQFPSICREFGEYATLRDLQKRYQEAHHDLLERIRSAAASQLLKADTVIQDLLAAGKPISTSDEILQRARSRVDRGNPPGKAGSLGDAINWECLLQEVPSETDLVLVSGDGDFASALDPDELNPFLAMEWRAQKTSVVTFFRRLSDFLREEAPYIRISESDEVNALIAELATSPSFSSTHEIVARLRAFSDFSVAQRVAYLKALVENNQVSWIITDEDVRDLTRTMIGDGSGIPLDLVAEVEGTLRALTTIPEWLLKEFE